MLPTEAVAASDDVAEALWRHGVHPPSEEETWWWMIERGRFALHTALLFTKTSRALRAECGNPDPLTCSTCGEVACVCCETLCIEQCVGACGV